MIPAFTILLFILIFIFGAIIGSFLNVVILRHEKDEKLTGRSYCPGCKKKLVWYELVPIFSYLIQRGRCRGCSAKVSIQYPLVELVTAILFFLVLFTKLSTSDVSSLVIRDYVALTLELAVWSVLIVITVYDFRTKLIPDRFSYLFAALSLLLLFVSSIAIPHIPFPTAWLLAGPLYFLPFYLLWKISDGRWIGLGDGKLALGIGWFLGPTQGGTALLLAFWIGAGVSLLLIGTQQLLVLSKRSTSSVGKSQLSLKSEIPFGPFLVFGVLVVYLFDLDIIANILL